MKYTPYLIERVMKMIIPELAETCLKVGAGALIVIVFLYLYINNAREKSKQLKDANETITDINKRIFDLFTTQVKVIAEETHENKKLNKDISVIQAQIQKQLQDHDKYTTEIWDKQLNAMNRLCDQLNGNNPKIKLIMDEIDDLKKEIRK